MDGSSSGIPPMPNVYCPPSTSENSAGQYLAPRRSRPAGTTKIHFLITAIIPAPSRSTSPLRRRLDARCMSSQRNHSSISSMLHAGECHHSYVACGSVIVSRHRVSCRLTPALPIDLGRAMICNMSALNGPGIADHRAVRHFKANRMHFSAVMTRRRRGGPSRSVVGVVCLPRRLGTSHCAGVGRRNIIMCACCPRNAQ
ncbi:hypothetical protein BD410DRAFT_498469 [Rickenella mellea]|uniref:Uncharacterized protein n=1 Tax=Rickenella mellea TaxID=50990 RepID=A0A4Y7PVB5_9AGAM|nr:hypothetical protein BD410DRAFT_498469 [Rickenella mellea]